MVYEALGQGDDRVATSVSWVLTSGQEVERLDAVNLTDTTALNLTGNERANTLIGNNGANVLDGKSGDDVLSGAHGADIFAFTTGLFVSSSNADVITDFASGIDMIALDNAVFVGLAEGALAAGAFRIGTAAQDADDRIIYDPSSGRLLFDDDGDFSGSAMLFATLTNQPALTASDFTVI